MTLLEFADLLETTDKEQCQGQMFNGEKCCALGLYALKEYPAYTGEDDSPGDMEVWAFAQKVFSETGVSLVRSNDNKGLTFKAIGQLLRRKLERIAVCGPA